jgi:sulfate/thiosulfate-binding protein
MSVSGLSNSFHGRRELGSSILATALLSLVTLCGCGGDSTGKAGATDTLRIGAYSVVKEVFHEKLLPTFAAQWKQKTGRTVTFEESYNASGAQARAIKSGLPSDVAILSLEGDMEQLVEAGLVKSTWKDTPNKGMLTRSLVVIGVRPGNPKAIKDWDDLAKPGVGVLYPDPKTSGGAKWNIGAMYGAALLKSKAEHDGKPDLEAVKSLLAKVQANVVNMDSSGRQSMTTFERDSSDAIVTYENELLFRKKQGRDIPYIVPPSTLQIDGPVALVDKNVDKNKSREVAEAFLAFMLSPEGQAIFVEYGFRPVDPKAPDTDKPPLPEKLFTIGDLGGWKAVNKEVFGPTGLWSAVFAGSK